MTLLSSPKLGTLACGGRSLTPEQGQYMIDQFGHLVAQFVEGNGANVHAANADNGHAAPTLHAGHRWTWNTVALRWDTTPPVPYVEPDDQVLSEPL